MQQDGAPNMISRRFAVLKMRFTGRLRPQRSWAFAEFDPDLRIEMRGLTIQDENVLLAQPLPAHTELIGVWFDDAYGAARYTICRTSEGLFLSTLHLGSTKGLVQELSKSPRTRVSESLRGRKAPGWAICT
jgi:hypothetical protein